MSRRILITTMLFLLFLGSDIEAVAFSRWFAVTGLTPNTIIEFWVMPADCITIGQIAPGLSGKTDATGKAIFEVIAVNQTSACLGIEVIQVAGKCLKLEFQTEKCTVDNHWFPKILSVAGRGVCPMDVCTQGQSSSSPLDATACVYEIPTLSEWAMIVFSVLLLGLMTWYVVKRRRTAQTVAV